jgi:hypothetical protein
MKPFYIIGLLLVPALILISLHFRNEYLGTLFVTYPNGEMYLASLHSFELFAQLEKITRTGCFSGLAFEVFFLVYFFRALRHLPAFVPRMMNLIAAALSVIAVLLTFIPLILPEEVYFPGIAILLISYALLMSPCCIINLIYAKKSTADSTAGN